MEFLGVALVSKIIWFQVYNPIIHHLYHVFTIPSLLPSPSAPVLLIVTFQGHIAWSLNRYLILFTAVLVELNARSISGSCFPFAPFDRPTDRWRDLPAGVSFVKARAGSLPQVGLTAQRPLCESASHDAGRESGSGAGTWTLDL